MKTGINEEKLIKHLTPKIERIVYRTVRDILPFEEIYPPESRLRKGFIKNVKESEKRIRQGKGKTYTYKEFKKKFLGKLNG